MLELIHPRQNIDIRFSSLAKALVTCGLPISRQRNREDIERRFCDQSSSAISCLSVRTGLDLFLQAAKFPAGSEVLVSALTIPDIKTILEFHTLKVIPIDVDPATLSPKLDDAFQQVRPKTVAVLLAHLFGTRIPMQPWIDFAHQCQQRFGDRLQIWEDCAQAFTGFNEPLHHPQSDLAMFSFGPIKTATALGGAVLRLRDTELAESTRQIRDALPIHSRNRFAKRLSKYLGLKALSQPWLFPYFVRRVNGQGQSLNEAIQEAMRGFSGDELIPNIRHQMCSPQLMLLRSRLQENHQPRIERRRTNGARLANQLSLRVQRPGQATDSSFWVFPIFCDCPEEVQARLLKVGFDSTISPTLCAIEATEPNANGVASREATLFQQQSIYVPVYVGLSPSEIDRLARTLNEIFDN